MATTADATDSADTDEEADYPALCESCGERAVKEHDNSDVPVCHNCGYTEDGRLLVDFDKRDESNPRPWVDPHERSADRRPRYKNSGRVALYGVLPSVPRD